MKGRNVGQLELFDKVITVKICSFQGHQTFYLAAYDVKEFILKQSKKLKLWLYIDGVNMHPQQIESDIISSAREIILTRALVGG